MGANATVVIPGAAAKTPADLVAEVAGTTFTHSGGADPTQNYTYVVTAIGNNCWKLESTPSKRCRQVRLYRWTWAVRLYAYL